MRDVSAVAEGVNVAGFFRAELGVGEAARLLVASLRAAEIPHAVVPYFETASRQDHPFAYGSSDHPMYDVTIACLNAEQLPEFQYYEERRLFRGKYAIGMWWWEVASFPARLAKAAAVLDEIWVGSNYSAEAVRRAVDKPVFVMPPPIVAREGDASTREDLGLPEGFLFLFVYDFFSVFERKNPLALVRAFRAAFPSRPDVHLVLKSVNGHRFPHHLDSLRAAAAGSNILVIDDYWSSVRMGALVAACDAYVSLHRSEGFGLTLAEAMVLGKPVVGTAYSGNLEFMNGANSYLVPYRLVPIPRGCDPYPAGALWAEPDIDAAAQMMCRVLENPGEARSRACRGKEEAERLHSPLVRGRIITERLSAIRAYRTSRDASPESLAPGGIEASQLSPRLAEAAERVERDPFLGSRHALVRLFQKITLRVLRPILSHQRVVDRALLAANADLESRLDAALRRVDELERLLPGRRDSQRRAEQDEHNGQVP